MANNCAGIFDLKETKQNKEQSVIQGTINAHAEVIRKIENGEI